VHYAQCIPYLGTKPDLELDSTELGLCSQTLSPPQTPTDPPSSSVAMPVKFHLQTDQETMVYLSEELDCRLSHLLLHNIQLVRIMLILPLHTPSPLSWSTSFGPLYYSRGVWLVDLPNTQSTKNVYSKNVYSKNVYSSSGILCKKACFQREIYTN
jgi:hypothetical protein